MADEPSVTKIKSYTIGDFTVISNSNMEEIEITDANGNDVSNLLYNGIAASEADFLTEDEVTMPVEMTIHLASECQSITLINVDSNENEEEVDAFIDDCASAEYSGNAVTVFFNYFSHPGSGKFKMVITCDEIQDGGGY